MRIFQADSPLMEALSRVADLVILNLVTLLCCIPVVTAGAAFTGMHYVLRKMARDEEGYIVRSYFRSFKENFRQATAMWLLFLVAGGLLFVDLRLIGDAQTAALVRLPGAFRVVLLAAGLYAALMFLYAFPLLARFQNTVFGTLRNAAVLVVAAFPRTLGMALASLALPVAVLFFTPLFPVLLLAGLTLPGLICAYLYGPVFSRLEGGSRGQGAAQGEDPDEWALPEEDAAEGRQ